MRPVKGAWREWTGTGSEATASATRRAVRTSLCARTSFKPRSSCQKVSSGWAFHGFVVLFEQNRINSRVSMLPRSLGHRCRKAGGRCRRAVKSANGRVLIQRPRLSWHLLRRPWRFRGASKRCNRDRRRRVHVRLGDLRHRPRRCMQHQGGRVASRRAPEHFCNPAARCSPSPCSSPAQRPRMRLSLRAPECVRIRGRDSAPGGVSTLLRCFVVL
jgi:hypothetical protein